MVLPIPDLLAIVLNNQEPMAKRHRAIYVLRSLSSPEAVKALCSVNKENSPSALLRHEVAYILGQMQLEDAVERLVEILKDKEEHAMVRHEAAEALGALGVPRTIALLKEFATDSAPEVSDTCNLALQSLVWHQSSEAGVESRYLSVDPAPPINATEKDIPELEAKLLNSELPLFERYSALFGLREIGNSKAVNSIVKALTASSALLRHEVAYVLGQTQHPEAAEPLEKVLRNPNEHSMVRHEAAEALGAIANEKSLPLLREFQVDHDPIVAESCEVALDVHEYFSSDQFQYAPEEEAAEFKINNEKKRSTE